MQSTSPGDLWLACICLIGIVGLLVYMAGAWWINSDKLENPRRLLIGLVATWGGGSLLMIVVGLLFIGHQAPIR